VKIPAYSSVTAFMAHYRALKSSTNRSRDDEQLLGDMTATIATLQPETRVALDSTDDSPIAKRHRERAELQLRRELVARGIVAA
jgi:hypothetical protein